MLGVGLLGPAHPRQPRHRSCSCPTVALQSYLVTSTKDRNKAAREQVAKIYYETALYAHGIRILGGQGIHA